MFMSSNTRDLYNTVTTSSQVLGSEIEGFLIENQDLSTNGGFDTVINLVTQYHLHQR